MPLASATPAPAALFDVLNSLGLSQEHTPVFLVFFRSDCPWCASDLPQFAQIFRRHTDLELHIIGVAVGNDTPERAQEFARDKEWTLPVVTDPSGALRAAFQIGRVPAIVMVNATGLVERTYEGATEQLTGILEQTIFAAAHKTAPPEYDMVGNGCAP